MALGLATAEAIASVSGLICDLRWPNDIMIGAKKAAGILTQLADSSAVAGIGVNVNHERFPNELAEGGDFIAHRVRTPAIAGSAS